VAGSYEHTNEPSDSVICWEHLEQLGNWMLLKDSSIEFVHSPISTENKQRLMLHEPRQLQIQPEITAALVPTV
jgi:hypothetical protein